jgi:quinoprotein glucose dehydrogenase
MKRIYIIVSICCISFVGFLVGCGGNRGTSSSNELSNKMQRTWSEYLGGPHRTHYSALNQINRSNVGQLAVAWEYALDDTGNIETSPVIIGDTLYGKGANGLPFAVNAATGKEYWKIEGKEYNFASNSRGVNYWASGEDKRIIYTHGPWLYAIDATTGKSVVSFGDSGRVSLKEGLNKASENKMVISTSPGAIYKDIIIMPLRVSESEGAAKGFIQAFNIKTGNLVWVYRTIPNPGEDGYDSWPKNAYENPEIGGANSWAGMAIDRERGIVYVPTGSAAFDFYGGNRIGKNLFASSLLALDVQSGKRIWSFQFVHHDIFDRDPPAPPTLLTVTRDGKKVDAVAEITKQGYVFLFNRVTGEPLFPVKETPVPQSHVPGEQTWPTQPLPTKPAPFGRVKLTKEDINTHAENYDELLKVFHNSRSEGPFTPAGMKQATLIFPGLDGGGEWGGAAVDPDGILYVNSSAVPWVLKLLPKFSERELEKLTVGHQLFLTTCSRCHGANLQGNKGAGIPALFDIKQHQSKDYVAQVISNGRGMMPAFGSVLTKEESKSIVDYIFGEEKEAKDKSGSDKSEKKQFERNKLGVPYKIYISRFMTAGGYPAINPPWGTLSAINMNTGEYVWRDTLGRHPELKEKYGTSKTGALNFGGPIVTAGNLLFIASTPDSLFKAYDKGTGELLWVTKLPAPGFATPATYEVDGKQYIVIACGGSSQLGIKARIIYVAFSLPK